MQRKWILGLIVCLGLAVLLFSVDPVFANGAPSTTDPGTDSQKAFVDIATMILKFLSRAWVIPALIAGKLMTNDFVYASVLRFDVYLWKLWTVMRMFANITLGVIFVGYILKQFFKPNAEGEVRGIVAKTVLAGILIQMSRFLMGVLVDFSTIGVAAVSAIPAQILEEQRDSMKHPIQVRDTVNVGGLGQDDHVHTEQNYKSIQFETILPNAGTVAGPLMFMGAGILRLVDLTYIDGAANTAGDGKQRDVSQITLKSALSLGVLIVVVVPMLVLVVVNFMRIFWLWIWIILSPFIVLDQVFNGPLQNSQEHGDKFKLGNMLGLIFQPVVVVGALSLGLILVIGVRSVLQEDVGFEEGWLDEMNTESHGETVMTIGGEGTSEMTVIGDLFEDIGSKVGGFLGQMIMIFFTVFILWSLVKVGFSSSKITAGVAEGMFKFAGDAAGAIPLPVVGMGVGGVQKAMKRAKGLSNAVKQRHERSANENINPFLESVGLVDDDTMDIDDRYQLVSAARNQNTLVGKAKGFWNAAQAMKKSKKVMKFTPGSEFHKAVVERIDDHQGMEYLKKKNVITGGDDVKKFTDIVGEDEKNLREYVYNTMLDGFSDTLPLGQRVPPSQIIFGQEEN